MSTHRQSKSGRSSVTTLLGAVVVLGLTLSAPAYAAKPDAPGNQSAQSGTGNGHASPTSTGKAGRSTSGKSTSGQSTSGQSTSGQATSGHASSSKASSHATTGTSGTSGEVQSPQPKSNADQNGTGANHSGPYDSTRDGSPSGNGNGKGAATGKPCAGCVGKADNKNPQGQYPGGSDHNAGYECDRNHGIGRSNPAHTGCTNEASTTPGATAPTANPLPTTTPATSNTVCQDEMAAPTDGCGSLSPSPSPACQDVAVLTGIECVAVAAPTSTEAAPAASGFSTPASADALLAAESSDVATTTASEATSSRAGTTAPDGVRTGLLPQTGASAALLWTALTGMMLLVGGLVVAGRARVRT